MFEGCFEDSLRSLAPSLTTDTKSRLLFECGMAAAETKYRNRRRKLGVISSVALLLAAGFGFVLGNGFSSPSHQMATTARQSDTEQDQLTYSVPANTGISATLAVAMPPSEVFELLDRIDSSERSILPEVPMSMQTPFGTRSLATEL